ncbi:MAG: hypothetical protein EZS28_019690 [Streblomastix strix]|uniref:Uncharacterized protein n=1 Tax=Streblomastix strix TaxID=222440 RepID=A0A5J4VQL0_9EUKA|nr:MAG: hypothetical protein EZS28_019690 [Streblomastix strix]
MLASCIRDAIETPINNKTNNPQFSQISTNSSVVSTDSQPGTLPQLITPFSAVAGATTTSSTAMKTMPYQRLQGNRVTQSASSITPFLETGKPAGS